MRGKRFVRRWKYNAVVLESLPFLLAISIGLPLPPPVDFLGILFLFLLPLLFRLGSFGRRVLFLGLLIRASLSLRLDILHLHIAFGLCLCLAR